MVWSIPFRWLTFHSMFLFVLTVVVLIKTKDPELVALSIRQWLPRVVIPEALEPSPWRAFCSCQGLGRQREKWSLAGNSHSLPGAADFPNSRQHVSISAYFHCFPFAKISQCNLLNKIFFPNFSLLLVKWISFLLDCSIPAFRILYYWCRLTVLCLPLGSSTIRAIACLEFVHWPHS